MPVRFCGRRFALLSGCAGPAIALAAALISSPAASDFVCVGNTTGAAVGDGIPGTSASGDGATATGGVACGTNANANGTGATALGARSTATGTGSTFIGADAGHTGLFAGIIPA